MVPTLGGFVRLFSDGSTLRPEAMTLLSFNHAERSAVPAYWDCDPGSVGVHVHTVFASHGVQLDPGPYLT